MQAYRIVDWWKFELLKNGKLATAKTKMESLRKSPLVYVRFPVHGHILTADYRRMVKRAGDLAAACDGLYKALVGLAGNQVREYRGWVLDDRQRPLNPGQVAELLFLPEEQVSQIFKILLDCEVKWVDFLDFPESLHKSMNVRSLSGDPKSGDDGKNREKKGAPFIEAVTEGYSKDKGFFETETEGGGVREKKGELEREEESQGGGEKNVEPQALPAAQPSVSGSGTDSVPVSDSKKLSASDSDSAPDSDSVSQAGPRAGPGAVGSEHSSEKERLFEIRRECKQTTLELTQIIHPHNNSDITTINDIYLQLQQRLIAGSPYPLFELSLNTARQCWRADRPIAMFVAAMKKPPFYYVPKKLSVVPGKFSQGRNIKGR